MDVLLDVSAIQLSEEQIQVILDLHSQLIQEDVKDSVRENVSVPTSIAFGQEKRFILPGNTDEFKEYESAQAMIADQLDSSLQSAATNSAQTTHRRLC